ncbi:MAG: hypothetical protein JWN29_43 [Acidimicrobiales bacterium]|nr:hypothetical protein [Acidimicrobiales bacterium]
MCRSKVAKQEASGSAMVDWVSLSAQILNGGAGPRVVLRAAGIDDLGEREVIEAEHGGAPVEQPHAVRFTGVQQLAGTYDPSAEVYATPFASADAEALTEMGAALLVVITETSGRADAGPIVAVTTTGEVLFPGDCHPAWARAFADYAIRMNQPPVKIIEELFLHPTSAAAQAFQASPEGATGGGPAGGPGR